MMKVTILAGNIARVAADALCTSTNPRLSLMMGTGASIRDRGGYEILRACEAVVAARGPLRAGTSWVTAAGALAARIIIHCVASDEAHRSSDDVVGSCVRDALAQAAENGCRSIAMPVFAAGHARMSLNRSLGAMAVAIEPKVEQVFIVLQDAERLQDAQAIVARRLPGVEVTIDRTMLGDDESVSLWSTDAL